MGATPTSSCCARSWVGWVLGYTIASKIGDLTRFSSPTKLAGVHRTVSDRPPSGGRDDRGPLAKNGPRGTRAGAHRCGLPRLPAPGVLVSGASRPGLTSPANCPPPPPGRCSPVVSRSLPEGPMGALRSRENPRGRWVARASDPTWSSPPEEATGRWTRFTSAPIAPDHAALREDRSAPSLPVAAGHLGRGAESVRALSLSHPSPIRSAS